MPLGEMVCCECRLDIPIEISKFVFSFNDSKYHRLKRKGLFQVPSFSDPLGARTQDPNIKSVVLYLLS